MFCDQLAYLRKRAGLTQEELADALGIKRATIAMYETGKRNPNFETLEAIADYFNTTMDFLIANEKSPTNMAGPQGKLLVLFNLLSPEEQAEIAGHIEYLASKHK